MTKPHPHKDKIIQFAQDTTQKVWFRGKDHSDWIRWNWPIFPEFYADYDWHVGHTPPEEPEVMEFTFRGNAPHRESPPWGTKYWCIDSIGIICEVEWCDTYCDLQRLGWNAWKTKADASAFKAAAVGEKK